MPKDIENKEKISNADVHPDANGWKQRFPDSRGFKSGEKLEADGKWHSRFPDANGWYCSSSN